MTLADELKHDIREIFRKKWQVRDGQKVPEAEDLTLGNEAVALNATVLYADLADSTRMVDSHAWHVSAEVYKAYLHSASKLIRDEGGTITAFDGDRVMAVFIGKTKNTQAVRCALKIKYVVGKFLNPALESQYPNTKLKVTQVVGVDTSTLRVARTGVRGANDLVWVGRAANYAAKLSSINEEGYYTFITGDVYDRMLDDAKTSEGKSMWERRSWTTMNKMTIYRSSWGWVVG